MSLLDYVSEIYGYLYVYETYVSLIWYLHRFLLNKLCLRLTLSVKCTSFVPAKTLIGQCGHGMNHAGQYFVLSSVARCSNALTNQMSMMVSKTQKLLPASANTNLPWDWDLLGILGACACLIWKKVYMCVCRRKQYHLCGFNDFRNRRLALGQKFRLWYNSDKREAQLSPAHDWSYNFRFIYQFNCDTWLSIVIHIHCRFITTICNTLLISCAYIN